MGGAISRLLQMPGHQGGGAGQAAAVHLQDDTTPLAGTELFRAELPTHRLTQHLGGGAGDRPQTGGHQPIDHRLERPLVLFSDEQQLLGGEGMQMQAGGGRLQGPQQGLVVAEAGALQPRVRVESPLDAELGGPRRDGQGRALLQGFEAVPEGPLLACIPAKGTKAAVLEAVVGEIEVAVHHIGDPFPHKLLTALISQRTQCPVSGLVQQPGGQGPGFRAARVGCQGVLQMRLQLCGPTGTTNSLRRVGSGRNQAAIGLTPGPGFDPRRRITHRRRRPGVDTGCCRRRRSRHSTVER